MATNPNGPSLNDLMYASYNPNGYVNVTQSAFNPQIGQVFGPGSGLSENTAVTEKMTILIAGLSNNLGVEDFIVTSENISVVLPPNNNLLGIVVSDTTVTSEVVTRA